jgi:hypothetical protein
VLCALSACGPLARADAAATGKLTVRIEGLPAGAKPAGVLRGPGVKRKVTRRRVTLRRARAGTYTLRLRSATVRRTRGGIRKGSQAHPAARRVRVQLARGKAATLTGSYGTILARGTRAAPKRIARVEGSAENPTAIVVPRGAYRVGGYLTSGPTRQLPAGLVSKIIGRRRAAGGRLRLDLRAVPATEVVPVLRPDPAATARSARSAAKAVLPGIFDAKPSCYGGLGPQQSIGARVSFDGGGLGWDRPANRFQYDLAIHVDLAVALQVTGAAGCTLTMDFGTVPLSFLVGPIVIPGYLSNEASGSVSVSSSAGLSGSGRMTLGVAVDTALAGNAIDPYVSGTMGQPFRTEQQFDGTMKATLSERVVLGVGVKSVAALELRLSNGPEFGFDPYGEGCTFDLSYGSLELWATAGWFKSELGTIEPARLRVATFPECRVGDRPDPIIGDWELTDGGGTYRFEQTGAGSFSSLAMTNINVDDDQPPCRVLPAGSSYAPLHKRADGTYNWRFTLWDTSKEPCELTQTDDAATVELSPGASSLTVCGMFSGATPESPKVKRCDSMRRVPRQ